MDEIQVINQLCSDQIVAIVRGIRLDQIDEVANALYKGGIRNIEVTLNTPNAVEMIRYLSEHYNDKICVGAGTVLNASSAYAAIQAGAKFILSPSLHEDVIKICNQMKVVAVPGVLTPTEAIKASELGAKIIKIFPVGPLGASYVKQLLGPLNHLKFMVVGGITPSNIKDYFDAGAVCAGIGSDLVNKKIVDTGNYDEIYERAKCFKEMIKGE